MQDRIVSRRPPMRTASALWKIVAASAAFMIAVHAGPMASAQSWEEKTRQNFAPPTIARPDFGIQSPPGVSIDRPGSPPEVENPVEPPPSNGGDRGGWCPGIYPCWPWYPYHCYREYRRRWWAYPVYPGYGYYPDYYGYYPPYGAPRPVYPVPYPVYVPVDPLIGGRRDPALPNAGRAERDDAAPDADEMLDRLEQRAKETARQEIRIGDSLFAQGKYAEASVRYRRAIRADGTLADAWIRQALALIALGNYPTAVEMMKRGLALAPDWAQRGFRLDDLYGKDGVAKRVHIGDLAREVAANPNNAGRLFLLGVMLYFDGEREAAGEFFRRSAANDAAGTLPIDAFSENAGH
ncbi:hypothetical protein JCM19992_16060 [Thermostilla marina]